MLLSEQAVLGMLPSAKVHNPPLVACSCDTTPLRTAMDNHHSGRSKITNARLRMSPTPRGRVRFLREKFLKTHNRPVNTDTIERRLLDINLHAEQGVVTRLSRSRQRAEMTSCRLLLFLSWKHPPLPH